MIMTFNIIFAAMALVASVDIAHRHANGANYRQLLNKKNKTRMESRCLKECEKFFKVTLVHKLCLKSSAIYFILVSTL